MIAEPVAWSIHPSMDRVNGLGTPADVNSELRIFIWQHYGHIGGDTDS